MIRNFAVYDSWKRFQFPTHGADRNSAVTVQTGMISIIDATIAIVCVQYGIGL